MNYDNDFTRYIEPTSPEICVMLQSNRMPVFYNERILSSRAAAAYLGVSTNQLSRMRAEGRSPAYHKSAGKYGRVAYAESALAEFKQAGLPWAPTRQHSRIDRIREFAFVM